MKIFDKIKSLFQSKPIWQLKEGHVITPAFVLDGVQYYALEDSYRTFTERGWAALSVYEEWQNRMTNDNLIQFFKAMQTELSGTNGQINLSKVSDLVNKGLERIEWVVPTTEIMWKMAGVAFFDKNESPYVYDQIYCAKKIERWKKAVKDQNVFFCDVPLPLRSMFPLPNLSADDLKICEEIQGLSEEMLQRIITGILSKSGTKTPMS